MLHCKFQPGRSRLVRRAALAALLASTAWQSTSQADSPSTLKLELLPPLPVQVGQLGVTASQVVLKRGSNENPFCQAPAEDITLVSGADQAGLLQPTTEVLLLQPVSEQAARPSVVEEAPVELVKPKSTLRLTPVMPSAPAPAVPDSSGAGVVANPYVTEKAVSPGSSAEDVAAAEQQAVATPTATDSDSESSPAITFQMSDEPAVYSLGDLGTEEPVSERSVRTDSASSTRRSTGLPVPVTLKELPTDGDAQEAAGAPGWLMEAARQDGKIRANAPAVSAGKPSKPNVPKPVLDTESNLSEPNLAVPSLPVTLAQPPLATNRATTSRLWRPAGSTPANALDSSPIVVGAGPSVDTTAELVGRSQGLVIDVPADDDPSLKTPAVSAVSVPNPTPSDQIIATVASVEAAPRQAVTVFDQATAVIDDIDVAKAHMRPLQLQQTVRRFLVEDDTICRVVAVGPHELRIIGQQAGSSRLAIWTGSDETAEPRFYNIRVEHRPQSQLQNLQRTADELTKSLLATFPNSRVRVVAANQQLVIQGVAVDDDQARSILQLVRQTCLVPVVDQLSTR